MISPGRTDPAAAIGRGRRQCQPALLQYRAYHRMRRAAQRNGRQASGDCGSDSRARSERNHHGQRARPQRARQRPGTVIHHRKLFCLIERSDMDDQRIEIRPALGAIDRRYGFGTISPRGEPVDRFGG